MLPRRCDGPSWRRQALGRRAKAVPWFRSQLEIDGVKKQVKAKLVVGDPSYFPGKTRVTSQV